MRAGRQHPLLSRSNQAGAGNPQFPQRLSAPDMLADHHHVCCVSRLLRAVGARTGDGPRYSYTTGSSLRKL